MIPFVLATQNVLDFFDDDSSEVLKTRPDLAPGTGFWMRDRADNEVSMFSFVCPCGCGKVGRIPVGPKWVQGKAWGWNGSLEKPTLTPSIFNTGWPCKWHGFLTDGVWVSV